MKSTVNLTYSVLTYNSLFFVYTYLFFADESWNGTVGPSGQQGTNNVGSKQPQTAADFISPNSTVSSFSNFATEKLASNAMESYIGEFLRDLKL